MLKKFIKIFILIIITGALIYKFFFYVDIKNKCVLRIKPSIIELSTKNIKQAIKIMKLVTPEEYEKLCRHVNIINPNYSCGGLGGGCYYSSRKSAKEIDISTAHGGFLGQTAGVIAHETCHAIQNQEGRELNENECYGIFDKEIKKIVEY